MAIDVKGRPMGAIGIAPDRRRGKLGNDFDHLPADDEPEVDLCYSGIDVSRFG